MEVAAGAGDFGSTEEASGRGPLLSTREHAGRFSVLSPLQSNLKLIKNAGVSGASHRQPGSLAQSPPPPIFNTDSRFED